MASRDKKLTEKREDSSKSEIMHRLKTHPFLFVGTVLILVIVIVAFVLVPAIVPNSQRGKELIFGYYNKIPIKYVPGNYFYQVQSSLIQQQNLSQDDPAYISKLGQIWREAFTETAVHIGILDEMKQAGFTAPPDVVDREVAALPFLQENGRFSSAKYRAMDNNSRLNLWRQVQDNVSVERYRADLTNLKISAKETAFIGSMASPRRSFDLAAFPISSYPDSEIVSYAAANPDLFRITRLSRITVNSSEREARQILESVKNGVSTFEETAKTNSQDMYADRGGDMGVMMAYELKYEISDEAEREHVINLARGELSDVIKVFSGWAFFRAEEPSHPADLNDTAQIGKIRNYIMENSRGLAEDWLISQAEQFTAHAEASSFDDAVLAENITKRSFGPIPVNYGNTAMFPSLTSAGVPELANAATNEFFWKLAFSTPINSISKPLVAGDNVIVLLPLEESYAEESDTGFIEMYYPYWVHEIAEYSNRNKFMASDKLNDHFAEVFNSLWRGF